MPESAFLVQKKPGFCFFWTEEKRRNTVPQNFLRYLQRVCHWHIILTPDSGSPLFYGLSFSQPTANTGTHQTDHSLPLAKPETPLLPPSFITTTQLPPYSPCPPFLPPPLPMHTAYYVEPSPNKQAIYLPTLGLRRGASWEPVLSCSWDPWQAAGPGEPWWLRQLAPVILRAGLSRAWTALAILYRLELLHGSGNYLGKMVQRVDRRGLGLRKEEAGTAKCVAIPGNKAWGGGVCLGGYHQSGVFG